MRVTRSGGLLAAALLGLALTGGCGGGGGGGDSKSHLRAVDASPNAGTVTLYADANPIFGLLNYLNVINLGQPATPYTDWATGTQTFTFTASAGSGAAAPPRQLALNGGQSYTALLIGRADLGVNDARSLQVVIPPQPSTGPPKGQANVRVLHAVPDAELVSAASGLFVNALNVTVNGSSAALTVPYGTASPYQAVSPGTVTLNVSVPLAIPGGGTVTAGPASFGVQDGHAYTFIVAESTLATYNADGTVAQPPVLQIAQTQD